MIMDHAAKQKIGVVSKPGQRLKLCKKSGK